MKIDIKTLTDLLYGADAGESVKLNDTEPYLIKAVLEPCKRGEYPKISDLDYSRFELIDLRILCDYYERMEQASYRMYELNRVLCDAEPKSCESRAFC